MRAKLPVGGGYARISTLNQDSRQGQYHPHRNVSKHTIWDNNEVQVVCMDCGKRWYHPRRFVDNVPPTCPKPSRAAPSSSESLAVGGELVEGDVRWKVK